MSQDHKKMVIALQKIVVTKLRERGFKGTFPHFRRLKSNQIELVTFQFDSWGGGFIIEISKCSTNGIITLWGQNIPPNKVRAWDMHPNERMRLQPGSEGGTKGWFRYDNLLPGADIFTKTANQVLPYLEIAEEWWKNSA